MGGRFEDVFGRPFLPGIWRLFPSEELVWAPAIDVVEKEDKFFVKVELPGVKEEDVTVTGPYGSFASCLKIKEWTPLEPDFLEYKYYSLGVGLVLEENAETGECVELIDTMTDNKG